MDGWINGSLLGVKVEGKIQLSNQTDLRHLSFNIGSLV